MRKLVLRVHIVMHPISASVSIGSKDFHDVIDLDSPLSLPVRQGASIAQFNNIVQKLVQKYSHMAITKQPHKLGGSIQE